MPRTLDEITNSLAKPDALTDGELVSASAELRAQFTSIRSGETEVADVVGTLTSIADHIEGIAYVQDLRAERAVNDQARLAELDARLPALGTVQPPARQRASRHTMVTGGESMLTRMPDHSPTTLDGVVDEMIERVAAWGGDHRNFEMVPIARLDLKALYPEDRRLTDDEHADNAKLDALTANAWDPARWDDALVASGGFCAPAMPDYELPQLSGVQRPVKNYLPGVLIERGQVVVQTVPKLSDVQSSTAQVAGSAVSVWTNAIDTTPGGTTKPVQTVPCPTTQTIAAQAIVSQLQFGNFETRAQPELVKLWVANTASAWARRAESEALRQIDSFSLAVSTTQILGAANDFVGYLRQAASAIRSRQRLPFDPPARLRLLVPAWLGDFLVADIAHEHAGDGDDEHGNPLRFTLDGLGLVRSICDSAGVNVAFYEDTAATGATTNQLFVPQAAGDLENFRPTPGVTSSRVICYLFTEGAFTLGDMGTLDLGLVRDSTLNNTNDYRLFSESWEAVIPKIIEAQKITMTLCTTGAGALDVSSASYCTAS